MEISKTTNGLKSNPINKVDGLNNGMLAFFMLFCAYFALENVMTHGIMKGPIELIYDFIGFMQINWGCYVLMFLGYLVQIFLCYLNEKCLAMGILSEKLGMALHVFIALISFNLCSILCLVYKFNPVAGVLSMAYILLASVKFWSYAYENKKLRKFYKRSLIRKTRDVSGKANLNGAIITIKTINYPENVTLKRAVKFLVCTSASVYRINCPLSKPANYKKVFKCIVLSILNCYIAAFFIYQFVLPEMHKTVSYIDNGQYLNLIRSVLKLGLPLNITRLFFSYYHYFKLYLPAFAWLWGTEDVIVTQDWWNAENFTIFWSKWNYQTYMWLKECFFLPTLRMGYSKPIAGFVVTFVSGLLHEYLITVPCRCCYGLGIFTMLVQIPLGGLTAFVQRKYGDKWGNFALWICITLGHTINMILLYYNYNKL